MIILRQGAEPSRLLLILLKSTEIWQVRENQALGVTLLTNDTVASVAVQPPQIYPTSIALNRKVWEPRGDTQDIAQTLSPLGLDSLCPHIHTTPVKTCETAPSRRNWEVSLAKIEHSSEVNDEQYTTIIYSN